MVRVVNALDIIIIIILFRILFALCDKKGNNEKHLLWYGGCEDHKIAKQHTKYKPGLRRSDGIIQQFLWIYGCAVPKPKRTMMWYFIISFTHTQGLQYNWQHLN